MSTRAGLFRYKNPRTVTKPTRIHHHQPKCTDRKNPGAMNTSMPNYIHSRKEKTTRAVGLCSRGSRSRRDSRRSSRGKGCRTSSHLVEPGGHRLRDFFVLMRQKRQSVGHVVPLAFRFAARETGRKFVGQLSGMFFLQSKRSTM